MISFLLFFELAVWTGCLLHCHANRQLSILQPVTILLGYHFLFHLMKPALWYYFDHNHAFEYMHFYPNEEDVTNSILISIVGLLTSYLAYVFFFRYDNLAIRARLAPAINSARTSSTTRALILVVLALSFVAFVQRLRGYLGSDDGFQLAQDARTGNLGFTEGSGWWFELSSAYVFCGVYLWITSGFSRVWGLIMSSLGFLWLTVGQSRFVFVYWAMTVAILVLTRSKFSFRKLLVLLPLGAILIIAFIALGQNRAAIREAVFGTSSPPRVSEWKRESPLDTLDISTFEVQTATVSIVPRLTDSYTYFTEHLRIVTEPIPRALWAGKPFGDPIKMFQINRFANLVSLSTGWYAEGWLSLGIIGVVITCLVYAMLSSLVMQVLLTSGGSNGAFAYTVLVPLHLQWMRDGVLVSVLKFSLFLTLPAIIAALSAAYTTKVHRPTYHPRRPSPPRA
ncbi:MULTISPECIES: hypothetical protein [unclassified Bradyrhizobium]|uniref:hypothetical protein n=1 Tax=unclassified Bradyrhizobium TaxID=2631580 RepID=UPI001FF8CBB3|nr:MULTISPECIES: hypothetical protein [unclassified Bradyrhizobium]MCK1325061.1 hypothetical protein [Bradyrhizobium sp. 156]MCK1498438.1 hypothetical protein [Bradyrhizobium sp. 188]